MAPPPCRSRGPAAPSLPADCEPAARRVHLCKARASAAGRRGGAAVASLQAVGQRAGTALAMAHYVPLRRPAGRQAGTAFATRAIIRLRRAGGSTYPQRPIRPTWGTKAPHPSRPTCPQWQDTPPLWQTAPTYFRALTQHCGTTGQTTACTYLYGVRAITYAGGRDAGLSHLTARKHSGYAVLPRRHSRLASTAGPLAQAMHIEPA